MKLPLLLLSIVLFSFGASAQKIKIKKGIVYADGVEYMSINKDFGNETFLSLDGEELFILKTYSFDKPNPAANNPNNPNSHKYASTVKQYYSVISFLNFELEFETDISRKNMIQAFIKYELLNAENQVVEENARKIAQLISKDISGTRPVVIFRQ